MNDFQKFLSDIFLWIEGGAALIAFCYFKRLKGQHWRYFIYYLIIIFICEVIGKCGGEYISFSKTKYYNGFIKEEESGDHIRMTFLSGSLTGFARWFMLFGDKANIIEPPELNNIIVQIAENILKKIELNKILLT